MEQLWVPRAFDAAADREIYIIPANHRGDMYHIRAALTVLPRPLLIHSWGGTATDLTEYLTKTISNPNNAFVTRWNWEQLTAADSPGADFIKRSFKLISESMATEKIKQTVTTKAKMTELANKMIIIHPDDLAGLRADLQALSSSLFPKATSGPTVLIQCRDTGTTMGVYPELDSGVDSVVQIATLIKAIPQSSGKQLNVVLCGNANDIGGLPSIKEYFKKIDSSKWPRSTKRDIEALFLKVSFEKPCEYYHMVAGFRSGGLDLFTFLGIPSISISAREIVGEGRHGNLANSTFKRWNLQYELPRHISTKYFKRPRDQKLELGSPWWTFDKSRDPTEAERREMSTPPTGFHPYDEQIIKLGFYHAVRSLLDWKTVPFIKPISLQDRQFPNKACRPCYFSDMEPQGKKPFFEKQRELERNDFRERDAQRQKRNETEAHYNECKNEMEEDWKKLIN